MLRIVPNEHTMEKNREGKWVFEKIYETDRVDAEGYRLTVKLTVSKGFSYASEVWTRADGSRTTLCGGEFKKRFPPFNGRATEKSILEAGQNIVARYGQEIIKGMQVHYENN